MSELIQMMTEQKKEISELKSMVHNLIVLQMKGKVDDTWVSEEIAAEMLGYKDHRGLRRKVVLSKTMMDAGKSVPYPFSLIDYRNTNGKRYQYNRKSLLKFKEATSNMN